MAGGQYATTSAAMASMGWGLATAVGAAFARPGHRVVLAEGDGSFSQNLQELATIRRHALPVKMFLIDNGGYASIRATQRKFFQGAYVGCDEATGLGFPDWIALFHAYGIPAEKLALTLLVLAIAAPAATVAALLTVAVEAEPITTLELAVTNAAVTSATVPVTVCPLVTVTVPLVALPAVVRSLASRVPAELVMVTVSSPRPLMVLAVLAA